MLITDILNEIDAYLSCLRQARDLLLAPIKEARPKEALPERPAPPKSKAKVARTRSNLSSKPRIHKTKSRSRPLGPERKVVKARVDSVAKAPVSPTRQPVASQQPAIVQPERKTQPGISRNLPPANGPITRVKSVRRRAAKRVIGAKRETSKPAIALAGSMNSKIVVVSAKQLQQERDRAARPEVKRERPAPTGLTGKLAFEALFKEETDPSKASS